MHPSFSAPSLRRHLSSSAPQYSTLFILLIFSLFLTSIHFPQYIAPNVFSTQGVNMPDSKATVYMTTDISPAGLERVIAPLLGNLDGKVGVKVHFGEPGNQHFIKPGLFQELVLRLNGTFIETNVLYGGKRRHTATHIEVARDHGFGFAPIDIINDEGSLAIPYKGAHFDTVYTGSHLTRYNSLLVISHFKGHGVAGFGGAVKNVGMGLADYRGKLEQHSGSNPKVNASKCIKCQKCLAQCPVNAITLDPLVLDLDKCIACGKCIGTCPTGALSVPWGKTGENGFLERLADYAKAISANRPAVYINVIASVSPDCDCYGGARKPFIHDIGILASTDILAIDKASADLVDKAYGKPDAFLHAADASGKYLFVYGHKIGLGAVDYNLVELK